MKTIACVLESINKPLRIYELEIPSLKPGQVLVEVHYSGVCHSQLNEWRGLKGKDPYLPHTLGHEGSGFVLDIGKEVSRVKPGDKVVISWILSRGANVPGCCYNDGERVINSGAVSTFLTKAVISENRLVPVNNIPLDIAALLGCAVPTGCGIVINNLKPKAGSSIAVWGVGGVGLCSIMAAAALGCKQIFAIDIHPNKLEMAKNLGATHLVDGNDDPVSEILELTGGKGVDYGIEAAGLTQTIEAGYAVTRHFGGRFLIAGNPPKGENIEIDPFDLISGKNIGGTWGGESDLERDIPKYINLYEENKFPFKKLITHSFTLEQINDAFKLLETGRTGRILIENLK